ncbi:hypothetical protein ACUWEX_05535 [Okibacterium fritillariae]|uniref:hypothetical protein n=1 Tax=Okibacterium fritillariae TaxID=123320 RepID=UPI0040559944
MTDSWNNQYEAFSTSADPLIPRPPAPPTGPGLTPLPLHRWRLVNLYLLGIPLIVPVALIASFVAGRRAENRGRTPLPFEVSLLITSILIVLIIVILYIDQARAARRWRVLREHFSDALLIEVDVPKHTRAHVRMLRAAHHRMRSHAVLMVGPHGIGIFGDTDPLRPDLALRWDNVGRVATTASPRSVWIIIETRNPANPAENGVLVDLKMSPFHAATLLSYLKTEPQLAQTLAQVASWRDRLYTNA